ncbi:uncharacterized protein LOC135199652 [Macrobrachium nipponense]|uniref:uncharacterized protein LOC135199652 n=1 Tax=Macrobrachium nipponense TaxID=159736 RepID=UPI0030C7CC04
MPVVGMICEKIEIDRVVMDESDFCVVEGTNDKYDMLLGYKFLKRCMVVVHLSTNMIELRTKGNVHGELYLDKDGKVDSKLWKGGPLVAKERVKVPREVGEVRCEELERMEVIEKNETAWNSPIVPVHKPDGSLRMYKMHGMRVFTKLDLVRGYYQMPLEEGSRPVTAFSSGSYHYQSK